MACDIARVLTEGEFYRFLIRPEDDRNETCGGGLVAKGVST